MEKLNTKTLEDIVLFLNHHVETEVPVLKLGNLNRDVHFVVYNIPYCIEWWVNICYLKIGDRAMSRRAVLPFKHLYHDTTYPLVKGNTALGFASDRIKPTVLGNGLPFKSFRIPLEI